MDAPRFGDSERVAAVQSPVIPIVADWLRASPDTLSLAQGVVDYPPPAAIGPAVTEWLELGEEHHYGAVHGDPGLLEAIERKLVEEDGYSLGEDMRIAVTAGANMGFLNALLAISDPGDEVVLPSPFYFNQEMAAVMLGVTPVSVATEPGSWQLDPDDVARAITPRTRAVVTVSPNNPTGAIYPDEVLLAINDLCAASGLYHIHDHAYEYFYYGPDRPVTPAAIAGAANHSIALYSLSKSFALAGTRIGYMVIPEHLFEAVRKVQDTNLICATRMAQVAGTAAMREGASYCRRHIETFKSRRDAVLSTLGELGLAPSTPAGAFYVFTRLGRGLDDFAIAEHLAREYGVAVVPGSAFGEAGRNCLRVSYGGLNSEKQPIALERLRHGLSKALAECDPAAIPT